VPQAINKGSKGYTGFIGAKRTDLYRDNVRDFFFFSKIPNNYRKKKESLRQIPNRWCSKMQHEFEFLSDIKNSNSQEKTKK